MRIRIEEEATEEPVSLEEAKAWCKIEIDDDDSIVSSLITAARKHCERITNRSLAEQTVEVQFESFSNPLDLPFGPVDSVNLIFYWDESGQLVEMDEDEYSVFGGLPACIVPVDEFPQTESRIDAVLVQYVASGDVNETIKTAIKLLVLHWYQNRSAVEFGNAYEIPLAVESILLNEKNWRI